MGLLRFNRKKANPNPMIHIKNMCERIFKSRYQIYDEDVISDAIASIILQYNKNKSNINSLDGWVIGAIHYHYCAFVKRKEKENLFTYDELILENVTNDPYPHTKLDVDYIFEEIENLSFPQKEIITFRIIDGLAYDEIETKLNIKAATCRKHFERGILNIKKALQIVSLVLGLIYGKA